MKKNCYCFAVLQHRANPPSLKITTLSLMSKDAIRSMSEATEGMNDSKINALKENMRSFVSEALSLKEELCTFNDRAKLDA